MIVGQLYTKWMDLSVLQENWFSKNKNITKQKPTITKTTTKTPLAISLIITYRFNPTTKSTSTLFEFAPTFLPTLPFPNSSTTLVFCNTFESEIIFQGTKAQAATTPSPCLSHMHLGFAQTPHCPTAFYLSNSIGLWF
jgi:hypothetical protein